MEREVLFKMDVALTLASMKIEGNAESSSLHGLTSSSDPTKHQLTTSMIEQGVDGDSEGNTLMHLAIKNKAFDVIEALLEEAPNRYNLCEKHEDTVALILRSPNVAELLTLFFRYETDVARYVTICCDCLPWDMPEDHLVVAAKTLVQQAGHTRKSDVGKILRCVSTNNHKLAKYLLNCRTDANERLIDPQSLLSYFLKISDTAMLAFLIRDGADINDCVNDEKQYLLHFACRGDKLETARLLLQLGADVNVADEHGNTPFSSIPIHRREPRDFVYMDKLMVKHFACLASTGSKVNEKDLLAIRNEPKLQEFYESCIEELNRMKKVKAADGLSYYSFFSKTSYELSLLMRNPTIFNQLRKKLLPAEPNTFYAFKVDMIAKFGVARQMRNMLVSREGVLGEAFSGILPCIVLRKIARFSLDSKSFEKEYHLRKFLQYEDHFLNSFINTFS